MKAWNVIVGILFLSFVFNATTCFAEDYACSYGDSTRGYSVSGDRYNPDDTAEKECEWLKKPFFADSVPDGYPNCLKEYQLKQDAYNAGKCKPIVRQNFSSNNTECFYEYYEDDAGVKHKMMFSCVGSDEALRDRVKKMYESLK